MGDSRCVCVFCMCGSFTILRKVANSISVTSAVKINPLMPDDDYNCHLDDVGLLVRTDSALEIGLISCRTSPERDEN